MNEMRVLGILLAAGLFVGACDDPPPPAAPAPTPAAAPGAPAPPPAAAPAAATEAAPEVKAIEERTLSDDDFVASVEQNRDPFRSYLAEFAAPAKRVVRVQRKVLLSRYGLDELRLIAVVTGPVQPRAMFKAPTGVGVSVKRGDYISKNEGRIKQILPNKVVVQLEEESESQSKMADRVIELHPALEQQQALRVE